MQISFDGLFAKSLQKFLSKKLNFIKIWQLKVGQNKDLVCYRQCAWGLRQLVLKSGFRPKGRALGIWEKSENFNSLRPILFELCKKNYRGGFKLTPPPRRNRVKRQNFKTQHLTWPWDIHFLRVFKVSSFVGGPVFLTLLSIIQIAIKLLYFKSGR